MAALILCSCEAVFEHDISESAIILNSPVNGTVCTVSDVVLWWEVMKGAEHYHVQLVAPAFDSVRVFILDTLVEICRFEMFLNPGRYQLRIRGENEAYQSPYQYCSFTVTGTADLSQQTVHLLFPADNDTTNNPVQLLQWDSLPFASTYRLEIFDHNQPGTTLYSTTLPENQATYNFGSDGAYEWKIRAENEWSITPYSTRHILIDTHTPQPPQLILPAHNSTVTTEPVLFQWQHDLTAGSAIRDSLQVAVDQAFTNPFINIRTAGTMYSDSVPSGNIYWRVKSTDAAGNTGAWSSIYQFTAP